MKSIRAALFVFLLMVVPFALAESDQKTQPVGKVIFATGDASIQSESDTAIKGQTGVAVYVGQTLSTGAASHMHVQMMDGALLVLRPESAVNITYYQVDLVEPINTKILLDMKKGVVRSVTGKGGEANKQGFRLNTPVAAIGIRGTDFTVLANQSISSVSLSTGRVVVAPFSSVCPRYAVGACSGGEAVMLTASDRQMLAEVRAAKVSLVSKLSAVVVPDNVAPVHPAEAQSLRDAKELPVNDSGQIPSQVEANKTSNGQAGGGTKTGTDSSNTQASNSQTNKTSTATSSASNSVVSNASSTDITEKDASMNTNSAEKQENIKTAFSAITSLSVKNQDSSQVGATAEVASLGLVTAEVGPKESVTSELVSRVVAEKTLGDSIDTLANSSETPVVEPLQPLQDVPPIRVPVQPQPFYWGRWARYAENPEQAIALDPVKSKQIIASNRVYLLADSEQSLPNLPKSGKINFTLDKGEAGIMAGGDLLPATISNSSLEADFDYNRFKTGLQINADSLKGRTVMLSAEGNLLLDKGVFISSAGSSNMNVSGAFSNGANQAAYEFHDVENDITGVTSWKQ